MRFYPNRIPAPVGPKGPARWANLLTGLRRRYARSASQSARDAWRAPAVVEVGGVAVAGCTFKPLGLYAGQRYEIVRLFLRDGVTGEEVDVEQVSSHTSSPPGFEPGTSHAPTDSTSWELCATVRNPTWTPWGVSEVGVDVAELRSVRDELTWASRVAAGAGAFWLSVAFICSNDLVSLTSIPSESMAPGVRRGDLMLVDRRRPPASRAERSNGTSINRGTVGGFGVGDVVLFEPPPALREIATRNGTPLRSGEYFVKRIVAAGGDEVEVVDGVLFRNGRREASYPTGTPVGVGRNGPTSDETHDGGTCDACKFGRYDLSRRVVPAGSFLVLGDNRGGSNDGHVWGYLPEKNVLGRISFRVAPLNRAGVPSRGARRGGAGRRAMTRRRTFPKKHKRTFPKHKRPRRPKGSESIHASRPLFLRRPLSRRRRRRDRRRRQPGGGGGMIAAAELLLLFVFVFSSGTSSFTPPSAGSGNSGTSTARRNLRSNPSTSHAYSSTPRVFVFVAPRPFSLSLRPFFPQPFPFPRVTPSL